MDPIELETPAASAFYLRFIIYIVWLIPRFVLYIEFNIGYAIIPSHIGVFISQHPNTLEVFPTDSFGIFRIQLNVHIIAAFRNDAGPASQSTSQNNVAFRYPSSSGDSDNLATLC